MGDRNPGSGPHLRAGPFCTPCGATDSISTLRVTTNGNVANSLRTSALLLVYFESHFPFFIMFKEFKDFALKGNVVDMAVGIIIGGAFGKIVSSFVSDIIMPPIGKMIGGVDFADLFISLSEGEFATLEAAKEAGAITINYGAFANTVIDFVIVAFAIFIVIKQMNKMKKQEEEAPAAPPEPSAEEKLLTEIRDLLKK